MSLDALDRGGGVVVTVYDFWDRALGTVDGDRAGALDLGCLECGEDVGFRGPAPSVNRRASFAHRPGRSCPHEARSVMSQEHREAQAWVLRVLRQTHPRDRVELEVPVDAGERGRGRGDVVVELNSGGRLCIEVQRSAMSEHAAAERQRQRAGAGHATEWIFLEERVRGGRRPVPGDSAIRAALAARGYAFLLEIPGDGFDFAAAPAPKLWVALARTMARAWKPALQLRAGEMLVMDVTRSLGDMRATPHGLLHRRLAEYMTGWLQARRDWLLRPPASPELVPTTAHHDRAVRKLEELKEEQRAAAARRKEAREQSSAATAAASNAAQRRDALQAALEPVATDLGRARDKLAAIDDPPAKWRFWRSEERTKALDALDASQAAVDAVEERAEHARKEYKAAIQNANALRELAETKRQCLEDAEEDVIELPTPAQREQRLRAAQDRDSQEHEKALADRARELAELKAQRKPHVDLAERWLAELTALTS